MSDRRRLLLSPLWFIVALATIVGLNATSAAAGSATETRVRAFEHVTVDSVGQHGSERPASVGCVRPETVAMAVGSCVATNTADDFVDLATPARRIHILDGDATGGGHLWPGLPDKTPFPQSWSADQIMHEISDIATDPAAWSNGITQGSRTVLTGVRDGVEIRVVVNTQTGEIITGTPTNLPRNP